MNLVLDIGDYIRERNGYKYYVMYFIGIYSGLRISDILKLKVRDVKNKYQIKTREKKTGKEKIFPINDDLKEILDDYCKDRDSYSWLIPSQITNNRKPVSRRMAYKVIHNAGVKFGLDNLGTHTLRKTFGYHFYMMTKDIALLQKILNHADQSITKRYIGIEQDDVNKAMRRLKYRRK